MSPKYDPVHYSEIVVNNISIMHWEFPVQEITDLNLQQIGLGNVSKS